MAPSIVSGSRPLLKPGGSHRAMTDEPAKRWLQATGMPFASSPADSRSKQYGRYMSCWMSSSRVQTTLTGPSTCLAISTARIDAVDSPAAGRSRRRSDGCARRPCPAAGRRPSRPPPGRARAPGCRPRSRSHPCGHEPCSSSAPSSRARGTAPGRSLRPWSPRPASPCRHRRCSARPRPASSVACSSSRSDVLRC